MKKLDSRLKSENASLLLMDLSVRNDDNRPCSLSADGWELIDDAGYAVGGAAVCEGMLPADYVQADLWSITPHTGIRTMLVFPAGEAQPAMLLYQAADLHLRILLRPEKDDIGEYLREHRAKRMKKRVPVKIAEQWVIRDARGKKQYICIGRKK